MTTNPCGRFNTENLLELYSRLISAYGPQGWWPADSPFEVMVGAILTQNTAWTNVEKAIANLKSAGKLSNDGLLQMSEQELAGLIRPSGYFNVKARRLKNLCKWVQVMGGLESLDKYSTSKLRQEILKVNGIGPETADDILLYAFYRPVFVIDTYTRRLLKKLCLIDGNELYEDLRYSFESNLDPDAGLFNEFHALIVRHAKQKCHQSEGCGHCGVEQPFH